MPAIMRQLVPRDMAKISLLRRRLVCAGYHRPAAIGIYYGARIGLAALTVVLFAVAAPIISARLPDQVVPVLGLAIAACAFYFPDIWIGMRTRSLQQEYRDGFPDALDLLVVCVEAGLSLDAGISRVGQEIGHAHPALAQNFAMMALELRAGVTRANALHNLAERMGIDEVRSMVTLLVQSEELGTSVADALRLYADDMRTMRMLRAETKAQALPVKLTLPLGFFVFPTMLIVILLPVMIRIYRADSPEVMAQGGRIDRISPPIWHRSGHRGGHAWRLHLDVERHASRHRNGRRADRHAGPGGKWPRASHYRSIWARHRRLD